MISWRDGALHSLNEAESKILLGSLSNEQSFSSGFVVTVKSIMDHDAFNNRAATIMVPRESSIEPCRDDGIAEGGNEAREVEDAEKENLLSDKG